GRFLKSLAAIALVLLFAVPVRASTVNNPLKLFKRYFGYNLYIASAGNGVRGLGQPVPDLGGQLLATATLQVNIPPHAKVRSAFVYGKTYEKPTSPSASKAFVRGTGLGSPPPCPYPNKDNTPPAGDCIGQFPAIRSLHYPAMMYGKPLPTDQGARCSSGG